MDNIRPPQLAPRVLRTPLTSTSSSQTNSTFHPSPHRHEIGEMLGTLTGTLLPKHITTFHIYTKYATIASMPSKRPSTRGSRNIAGMQVVEFSFFGAMLTNNPRECPTLAVTHRQDLTRMTTWAVFTRDTFGRSTLQIAGSFFAVPHQPKLCHSYPRSYYVLLPRQTKYRAKSQGQRLYTCWSAQGSARLGVI